MVSNRARHTESGWRSQWESDWPSDRIGQVLGRVQLPLSNAEFALEQFLMSNGPRLDTETRMVLAGVRDCINHVAVSVRRLSDEDEDGSVGITRAA